MSLETLWQDIRYAARGLRAKPGFTAAVVATLGLGIGANAAMFGIVDRLLFRSPAYLTTPDRVQRVYLVRTFDGKENFGGWFQYTRFQDLNRWTTSFDVTAAVTENDAAVGVGDQAREMRISGVSAAFWSLFDAPPAIGRYFIPAEDTTPVGATVVVLSHAFWQTNYGGRADALGQRLKIAKVDYTIIGVAPDGFAGVSEGRSPIAWVPITTYAGTEFTWNPRDLSNWYMKYNISWMQMLARRKPGVEVTAATADISNAFKRSYDKQRGMSPNIASPELIRPRVVLSSVLAQRGPGANQTTRVARWVGGVAVVVMLIAAANVANLLLARALRRRRETAVRLALGVSRGRLISQLLTESVLLAATGGLAGVVIAQLGGAVLQRQFVPNGDAMGIAGDARTLLFVGVAVVLVGLLTGLAPALQSGRGDLTSALKSGAREGTYHRSRMRVALLVLQGALSVVLLVGAGLFVRSLNNVVGLRMGYDIDQLLWVGVEERGETLDAEQKSALRYRLRDAAKAIAGVENAGRAVTVPFWMAWDESIYVDGVDTAKINAMGSFRIQAGSPEVMATMGTRLLRGRTIETQDTEKSPKVVVISQAMAQGLWPGRDALGQCLRVGADTMPCTTVVGITEDVRADDAFAKDQMLYYFRPIEQADRGGGGLFVRVRGKPERVAESVRRGLQPLMPGAAYVTVTPMAQIYGPTIRSWRLGATMFVAFGLLALVLAAIGLYSVIAYNVQQRTHELGVRVAFGAQVADVIRLVLGEGLALTIAGLVIGGGVALFAGRWVAPLLFNVNPIDAAVYGIVGATLLTVATLACMVPALRAARVDPNVALRSD